MKILFSLLMCILLGLTVAPVARADNPYTDLITVNGVRFGFRVKRAADTKSADKVLLRVENMTDKKIQIFFRLWCKSVSGSEKTDSGTGFNIKPGAVQSGEFSGLWYYPLKAGDQITSVQLRELVVNPLDQPWSVWKNDKSYPSISFRVKPSEYNRYDKSYGWSVQLRHSYGQTAHFDFGLSAKKSQPRTPNRVHVKAGGVYEMEDATLLPVKPEESAKVLLWLDSVRVGAEDKGRYISPSENLKQNAAYDWLKAMINLIIAFSNHFDTIVSYSGEYLHVILGSVHSVQTAERH